jgi:NADPH2 dehydrogenase
VPDLATPLELGALTLQNRIVMPPMANNLADERGRVTDRLLEHYRRHASGGAALIVVEHAYVTREGRVHQQQLGIAEDDAVEGLAELARTIKAGGARTILQITHGGARCPSEATGRPPAGPSPVAVPGDREEPRTLTAEEIEEIPSLFAAAARRAIEAGFDGVEVHGAHGYLLNEFASPLTNRREDEYGGSLDNRLRLPEAVVRAVRDAIGSSALLAYRLAAEDGCEGGLSAADVAGFAPRLVEWGVEFVDCSGGLCGSRPESRTKQGFFAEAAAEVRRALRASGSGVPVSAVGGITEPEFADRLVRDEVVDLVCVGRAQLKDPEWPRKALEWLRGTQG